MDEADGQCRREGDGEVKYHRRTEAHQGSSHFIAHTNCSLSNVYLQIDLHLVWYGALTSANAVTMADRRTLAERSKSTGKREKETTKSKDHHYRQKISGYVTLLKSSVLSTAISYDYV